jgi:hypothetical protein
MGMEAAFAQITAKELTRFKKKPDLAYEQIVPELSSVLPEGLGDVEGFTESLEKTLRKQQQSLEEALKRTGDAKALKQGKAEFEKMAGHMLAQAKNQRQKSEGNRRFFSLQKYWHVLHYVLNGTGEAGDTPLGKCILGGTEFPIPADYGPLRYLTDSEVKEIAAALKKVDPKSLLLKLNRRDAESKRVYLARNMDNVGQWDYLPELFEDFRKFYQSAADDESAMLLKIV